VQLGDGGSIGSSGGSGDGAPAAAAALAAGLAACAAPLRALSLGGAGPRTLEAIAGALAAGGGRSSGGVVGGGGGGGGGGGEGSSGGLAGLQRLELANCSLDAAAGAALAGALRAGAPRLEELSVSGLKEAASGGSGSSGSGGGDGRGDGGGAAALLGPPLWGHPALARVDLGNTPLPPAAAVALGRLLRGERGSGVGPGSGPAAPLPGLELRLTGCRLGDEGAAHLAAALAPGAASSSGGGGCRATGLWLEEAGLGAAGAAALGAAAATCGGLQRLGLIGDAGAGGGGAEALAAALVGHGGLEELALAGLGFDGACPVFSGCCWPAAGYRPLPCLVAWPLSSRP
jgi:hypothetical protein